MATQSVDSNIRKKIFVMPKEPSTPKYLEPVSIVPTLTNSSIRTINRKIASKPMLITKAELQGIGAEINLVGYDPLAGLVNTTDKTFSCRLLNWVEPYVIKGFTKTLFYTEVNTELKVGDRVFIINGQYDSDLLIEKNKYKKGRDGYKILAIDYCKVVLDIDYSGVYPYTVSNDDDFIKIYYIRNQSEFLHANRATTTRGGKFEYKFNFYQNTIAFIDSNYTTTQAWGLNSGISNSPGFYVRSSTASWTNITTPLINSGSYSYALSPTYSNVNRIKIMNSDFTYNGKEFKEGYVYKWNVGPTQSEWIVDVTYFRPYLTKNNFRDGNFRGKWNGGLYGQYKSRINWHGDESVWNIGAMINTIWKKGTFKTLYTASQSYFASFDENGIPYQKVNSPNNAGRGFNFIANSLIEQSVIENGSFYTTKFGTQSTATFSVVENHILGQDISYLNKINKAFFNDCEFNNSYLKESELKNTKSNNSKFEQSKSINSYFNNSVLKNSSYNSDNLIKVFGYDELTASETLLPGFTFSSSNDIDQKVFKFYINKTGYERLRTSDTFYIKGLLINNLSIISGTSEADSQGILNFFDKKFKISTWTEYTEENYATTNSGKRGYEYSAFLSTPADNKYKFNSATGSFGLNGIRNYTEINIENPNSKYYSLDIWVSRFDINSLLGLSPDFNYNSSSLTYSLINNVDISKAYIVDSDFDSGIIENSDWNSGSHIESNYDNNITTQTVTGGTYSLSIDLNNQITATTSYNYTFRESELMKVGDIVFLDSVDFVVGLTASRIPDTYKITSNNNGVYKLKEIGTFSQLISLTASTGEFITNKAFNRFGHIKKLKITKSNVKSGFLRRSYIHNSLIQNLDYDYFDKDLTNLARIRSLVISDSIFSNNENILSNATYINSFFITGSDKWNAGIVHNSIWNGPTFSNGTIRSSRWISGIFNDGTFYNSRTFNGTSSLSIPYYYSENINSYYKSGTLPNNRYSWIDGEFLSGDFLKSDWESGTFSDGRFYYSKWYDGNFLNGYLGSNQLSSSDTLFYNGTISYTTVDNATIYAKDTSYYQTTTQSIIWQNGIFNNGLFGSETTQPVEHSATWENGQFNGGQFITNGKWKNGTFNGGKFLSSYGWSQSDSTTQSYYGWENGTFNGGEFGNANGLTNSIWYTGDFNGGIFKGRVWNNGIFLYGEFQGSGGNPVSGLTSANANLFVDSFTNSYWGKWRNGLFTNTKDSFIKNKKIFTIKQKSNIIEKVYIPPKKAKIKNALWQGGTFSHPSGEMYSSVWLDGVFEKGKFSYSSFNPYVKRNGSPTQSFNFNDATCYWQNGDLEQSDFYISKWKNGNFIIGTGIGMIYQNGITNYMNAFNIFWENGLWRTGNWYGSSFEFDGSVKSDYVYQILKRGMSWSGTSSCHIWNIFLASEGQEQTISNVTAASLGTSGWSSYFYAYNTSNANVNIGVGGKQGNN